MMEREILTIEQFLEELRKIQEEHGPIFDQVPKEREIEGVTLKMTCYACPEQYDAYLGDAKIGYLRLRHGIFYATYPDASGIDAYYNARVQGDGQFWDEEERVNELTKAVKALLEAHKDATHG